MRTKFSHRRIRGTRDQTRGFIYFIRQSEAASVVSYYFISPLRNTRSIWKRRTRQYFTQFLTWSYTAVAGDFCSIRLMTPQNGDTRNIDNDDKIQQPYLFRTTVGILRSKLVVYVSETIILSNISGYMIKE